MQRRQLYFIFTLAVLSFVAAAVTLGVALGKSKDGSEADSLSTAASAENATDEFITPTATLEQVTVSPSTRPSFRPSSEPTIETNFTETFEPSNFTETFEPSNSSMTDSPSQGENTTYWPSVSPTTANMTFDLVPSSSPIPSNSNDDLPTMKPTPRTTTQQPATASPSFHPTSLPSASPTSSSTTADTESPTSSPTKAPTSTLVSPPSPFPSASPSQDELKGRIATLTPTKKNDDTDEISGLGTRFYAIGDVPYSDAEARQLLVQIENLPLDAEFLIHVGDIRSARDGRSCTIDEYYDVAAILNQSHAPVFLVLGDNEWNDCPNIAQGFDHWMEVFGRFDEQWNHRFSIVRHEERPENFSFVHKRTLFFGLNLVGGLLHHGAQWEARLQDLYQWVKERVDSLVATGEPEADSVVIFGHANPSNDHADFFDQLKGYLSEDLVADIPFLYVNGDAHAWNYKTSFYDRSNFLRMQVEGGTREPPLQITLNNTNARSKQVSEVFTYDRMLPEVVI